MKNPRHIIITGASGAIGSALALAYAQPGITLALMGRKKTRLEQLAAQCQALGATPVIAALDVTNHDAIATWLIEFDQQHPVDLIIANAAITSNTAPDGNPENWQTIKQVLDINLYGALACVTPLVEAMQKRQSGQIALVSSLGAYVGMPITPAYCASKAALKVYGEALRGLLVKDQVEVNVICPGFVKSELSDKFPGPRPFMISAKKAALLIKKGLAKNQARISFPFPLNFGTWLLSVLPAAWAEKILARMHYGHTTTK